MKYPKLKSILIFFSLIIFILCFLVAFVDRIESPEFWVVSFCGLFFPILILISIIIFFCFLIKRSKWIFLPLLTFLICYKQISVIAPTRIHYDFDPLKSSNSIRILSWNVSRWDERNKEKRGGQSYRSLMLDYIESTGADILCFQEFFECTDPTLFESNIPALKQKGYPYYYFYPSSTLFDGKFQYGLCIFSKFPIVNSFFYTNLKGVHSEGLIFSDIVFKNRIIRVFNTHLESPGLSASDYSESGQLNLNSTVFSKIKNSYSLRNLQAIQAKQQIEKSPFPYIICTDLGDIPNSFAYFRIRSDCQDAFLEKGSGLGRTISHISPTLRIDYIFLKDSLRIKQFQCESLPYSDHYPLIADVEF